ncbi:MAG: nucleotidyltransferase domain-containing protein [Candidatus Berkelbacteria bacterium]|nr:MAG: nucleotidyltransferase domain-containing protein [Candidatus Berkelbacteria bacterium]QQG51592.1 MAG: nucleotidyltransferase domain-containing protein [Candidatus Berkelbacteria bacterium]
MYRTFMTQQNFDFVQQAIRRLAGEVEAKDGDGSFWVNYGSFVLNQQTPESDLDLLFIHSQPTAVRRIQSSFSGHDVTIYSLNRRDFVSDGQRRVFGGYFGGKVLNPLVTFNASEKDQSMLLEVGGLFIGQFASAIADKHVRRTSTKANLAADSVLARLHLCPWYRSYFLRYFTSPTFPQLWDKMSEVTTLSFLKAGIVTQDDDNFRYLNTLSLADLHETALEAVARFWALGSCLHGALPDFPAFYMQKAEQYVRDNRLENRLEEMMSFLQAQSNTGGTHVN